MVHRKGFIIIVFVKMHFIQRNQFNETNVTSHNFQQISGLKIFPECFRGPLKTLWRATFGPLIVHPWLKLKLFIAWPSLK